MFTLIVMVFSACFAYMTRASESPLFPYHAASLQIVGTVPSGLNILRMPTFQHNWLSLMVDVIPLTIVSFMESITIATKVASQKGQLDMLNHSQELIALGIGNMCNAFASGFPVAGSFSRYAPM